MSTQLTAERAIKNLTAYIAEKRLITGAWSTTQDGKELGCLLHALGNSEFNITSPGQCPASLMPAWLANWVPGAFDDAGQENAYHVAEIFRGVLETTKSFDTHQWEKLRVFFLCSQIDASIEASSKVCEGASYWEQVKSACVGMVVALKTGDAEKIIAAESAAKSAAKSAKSAAWSAAESAAESAKSAAWSAAWSAAESAKSAKSAAWSAAESAKSAAWSAAWSAAESAKSAKSAAWSAAKSAKSAKSAAWSAAKSAAWSAESAAWSAACVKQFTTLLTLANQIKGE